MGRDPARVPVLDLLRTSGTRREVAVEVPVDDLAITTARVVEGAEAEVDVVVEAVGSQIVVEGTVRAPWTGACRRCLEPVEGMLEVAVREVFERHHTEGETYPLDDDHIDLRPLVRDALLLSLPLAPLCEAGCLGPAPDTFPATVEGDDPDGGEGDDAARPPQRDPRWAGLDDLDLG